MQNEEVAVPETPPYVHVSIIISTYTCSTDEGIFFASVGMGVGINFIVGGGGGGGGGILNSFLACPLSACM